MSARYKGIDIIAGVEISAFRAWKRQVEGLLMEHELDTAVMPVDDASTPSRDLRAAAMISRCMTLDWVTEIEARIEAAGAHLTGRTLWAQIEADRNAFVRHSAPMYVTEFDEMLPQAGESVAKFIGRFQGAAQRLKEAERPRQNPDLQDAIFKKLRLARPAWDVVLQGYEGTITGETTLDEIKARLSGLEARNPLLAPSVGEQGVGEMALAAQGPQQQATSVMAEALAAATAVSEAAVIAMKEMKLEMVALRRSRGGGRASTSQQGRGTGGWEDRRPTCYLCGVKGHKQLDCPGPKDPSTPSPPYMCLSAAKSLVGDWIVDSGATSHMSPGGGGATPLLTTGDFRPRSPSNLGKGAARRTHLGSGTLHCGVRLGESS